MALGLNVVVGYAGLLDLGYVAFWAAGAYVAGWFMPHLRSPPKPMTSGPSRRPATCPASTSTCGSPCSPSGASRRLPG